MNLKKAMTITLAAALSGAALTGCGATTSLRSQSADSFDSSREITVVSRENGSGTRGAFIELFGIEEKDSSGTKIDHTTDEAVIANKTDVMLTNVSGDEYAIGYVSLGSLKDTVKALDIDGAKASAENVKNGAYKIARPFNIAVKEAELSDAANDFITFILSKDGQEVVSDGYIPVDDAAPEYTPSGISGKVTVAGSSSVSPIMEKLKEAYLEKNPDVSIEVQMSDSTSGMTGAIEGTCDIGMASRDLTEKEQATLKPIQIAIDGIAVIVNTENPTDELTSEKVKAIYTGEATEWSAVAE